MTQASMCPGSRIATAMRDPLAGVQGAALSEDAASHVDAIEGVYAWGGLAPHRTVQTLMG